MTLLRLLLGSACLLSYSPVFASDHGPEKICKNKDAFGDNAAQNVKGLYLKALFESNPFVLDVSTFGTGVNFMTSSDAMAKFLFECQSSDKKSCASAFKIHSEITAVLQSSTGSKGQYVVETPSAFKGRYDEAAFSNFLNENGSYSLKCNALFNPGKAAETSPAELKVGDKSYRQKFDLVAEIRKLEVGQNVDQIDKALDDKSGATVSVDLNRGEKLPVAIDQTKPATGDNVRLVENETIAAQIAIALPAVLKFVPIANEWGFSQNLALFTALDYKSNINPKEELDDLSFGFKYSGKLSYAPANDIYPLFPGFSIQSEFDRFDFDVRYITDIEERDSQQYFSALKVPAFNLHTSFSHFDALLEFKAVIDASDIDDIGDKVALEKIKTFGRLGYDIEFSTSIGEFLDYQVDLGATYYYRDSFGKNNADADLWDIGINFAPDQDSKLMLSLMYDRGESLTSLDEQETWKLGFAFKQ